MPRLQRPTGGQVDVCWEPSRPAGIIHCQPQPLRLFADHHSQV